MKLSVIVPAFNLQDYIEPCLRSVLEQQTTFNYEVIVCDDASTDCTAKVIRRLAAEFSHLKPVFKTRNAGLAANMQTLLNAVNGEYVAYLDGDDIALPGKLQIQVDYLDTHQDCGMVFHESDMFDSVTNETIKLYSKGHYNWQYIPHPSSVNDLVRYGTYMQASSVMFRNHANLTETIESNCQIILDFPFYVLNAGHLRAQIHFIDEVLGRYRIHPNSFGAQTQRSVSRRQQSLDDIVLACQRAKALGVAEDVIAAGIAHHQFATALYFLFRQEDTLFKHYIDLSAAQGFLFNDRHKLATENAHTPDELRMMLAS